MFDKIGNEIKVGSWILYAKTVDRSADLGIGFVTSATTTIVPGWDFMDPAGNKKRTEDTRSYDIRVTSIQGLSFTNTTLTSSGRVKNKLPPVYWKDIKLSFPERIVVLKELPEPFMKMLREVKSESPWKEWDRKWKEEHKEDTNVT